MHTTYCIPLTDYCSPIVVPCYIFKLFFFPVYKSDISDLCATPLHCLWLNINFMTKSVPSCLKPHIGSGVAAACNIT